MKLIYGLLLSIVLISSINAQDIQTRITFSRLQDSSVTDAVKKMEQDEIQDIYRENGKITVIAYYQLLDCGNYTASAKIKNDSIIITVNNSSRCNGNNKYFRLSASVDNPKNIQYKVWIDPEFTFLEEGEHIETFHHGFLLGDINGDKTRDSITVEYERVVEANDSISTECGRGTCYMTAKFGQGIPDIIRPSCYGMNIESLPDLNGDGRDEIIMGTYYSHGCCHDVLVLSYDGKKWNLFAEANTFNDDESDATHVIKKGRRYYLRYKNWDEDFEDIAEKEKRIKVK